MTIANLDLNEVTVAESGVTELYNPVHSTELNHLFYYILHELVTLLRNNSNTSKVNEAIILYFHYAVEVMSVYQAFLMLERSQLDGRQFKANDRFRLIKALSQNKVPELSSSIYLLKDGINPPPSWRLILRFFRDGIKNIYEPIKRPYFINYKNTVVTTVLTPLVNKYVKNNENKVVYCRLGQWFKPIKKNPKLNDESASQLIDKMLAIALSLFKGSENRISIIKIYLEQWLTEAFAYVTCYLEQINTKKNIIPNRIYLGTAGIIWNRILARAVKMNGGVVTRFDHGCGCGYFSEPILQEHFDFEDCDTYVTFSKHQSIAIKKTFSGRETVQSACPELKSLNMSDYYMEKVNRNQTTINKPPGKKTIMLATPVYPGEVYRACSTNYMNDIALLDCKIKLIKRMQEWGYHVIVKPHPAEALCVDPPQSIQTLFGNIVHYQPFEEIYQNADILMFINPASTIFSTLILSGKPLIYLDFNYSSFQKDARQLLEKRCRIVPGEFDEKNNIKIDWAELKQAIIDSVDYTSNEFAQQYFFN